MELSSRCLSHVSANQSDYDHRTAWQSTEGPRDNVSCRHPVISAKMHGQRLAARTSFTHYHPPHLWHWSQDQGRDLNSTWPCPPSSCTGLPWLSVMKSLLPHFGQGRGKGCVEGWQG